MTKLRASIILNASVVGIGQQGWRLLNSKEQALYMAIEDAMEPFFVDGSEWSVRGDACVRNDDIELALFFLDLFEEPIQIPELRM